MRLRGTALSGALLGAGAFLAGCAGPAGLALPGLCDGGSLLRESARYERMSDETADREFARLRQAVERGGSDCDRLRFALVAATQPGRRADAQALRALEAVGENRRGRGDALAGLAGLLTGALRERMDGEARTRAAVKKATEEQGRADACRRQLDELRNVEKLLHERETR